MRSGVVIVQDYIGMPQQPGNQVVHADEASWNHPFLEERGRPCARAISIENTIFQKVH